MVNFKDLFEVYNGKRVLITGHTGFKGSWLLKTLNLLGAEIKGYALSAEFENDLYNLLNGNSLCSSEINDIRDKTSLEECILSFKPDFVFHLAAQPLVRKSYKIPNETFEVNTIGTINVLDVVRKLEKECSVVIITTDKVYYNYEWPYPYRENDRLGGYDPYSASKACAELAIDCYRNSFFNLQQFEMHKKGISVARAGNVIGGGDWSSDRLIPDIIRALSLNECVTIRNPRAVRPWQHVMEPINGYLLLGAKLSIDPISFSGAYNFGPRPDDNLSVENLVKIIINKWGSGEYSIKSSDNDPHEAGILMLDTSHTAHTLNWRPRFNSKESIKDTIEWYKSFYNSKNISINLIENQIFKYLG